MKRLILITGLLTFLSAPIIAQIVRGDQFVFGPGALTSARRLLAGAGSPESGITAPIGALYLRTDGGSVTTAYLKESGTGNTGWIAVASTSGTLAQFAATTSAQLLGVLSNETGSDLAVFSTTPSITTPNFLGIATWADNVRQTFNPGADAAGLNVGSIAGDPGTPSNGDLWYDSMANELTARINGASVALGAGGGGAPADATYITQVAEAGLSAEQALAALSSGILRVATTTGVITSLGDVLPFANGGTNLASAADDTALVSSGSAWVATAVTNCTDTGGNHLNYTASTNSFSCGTSGAAAFTPRSLMSTIFEASGRFTSTTTGTGSVAFTSTGVVLSSSAIITSSATVTFVAVRAIVNGGGVFKAFPGEFGASLAIQNNMGTDLQAFVGLGSITVAGAGITYTSDHIGFKLVRAASGTTSLYATQAGGGTETASSALTTVAVDDLLDVSLRIDSAASVSYYWRKNASTWSAATTLTTNVPTTTTDQLVTFAVSNAGVATATDLQLSGAYYSR